MVTKYDFFDGECHAQKGHGDYVKDEDYEALKSDRDAQQKRADALAVENAELKSLSIKLFNLGYLHGHESTVEGYFVDVHRNDIDTYHDDVVAEIIEDEDKTPAAYAALAAIEAQGVEKFLDSEHCSQEAHGCACRYLDELREGK